MFARRSATSATKDLYFQSNLRADKIDEELAYLFKRMNMWLVHLGVESANDRVLDGHREEDHRRPDRALSQVSEGAQAFASCSS
jgi:radical SAM superfamily enzyme YgiQ (UPF0313 family)